MLARDMLSLPLAALWQQKVRTVLTTLGVVFGGFVLAASLSVGQGVQDTIRRESGRRDLLRRITIHPQWGPSEAELAKVDVNVEGKMSDERRTRIRRALAEYTARFAANAPRQPLTRETLETLAAIEHVESVVPVIRHYGYAVLDGQSQNADVASTRYEDRSLGERIIAGRTLASQSEKAAVVSEFLLYRLGIKDDAELDRVLGMKLRLEFRDYARQSGIGMYLIKADGGETSRDERAVLEKIKERIPSALDKLGLSAAEIETLQKALSSNPQVGGSTIAEEYPIVGVARLPTAEERAQPWDSLRPNADALLPVEPAHALLDRMPGRKESGVDQAVIVVDSEEHVREVFRRINDMGLNAHAPLEHVEQQRLIYLLIFGGTTCVAAVALLVAALGITNTMLMSVLERTREIGVMKAVGASESQLQFIFLCEGAIIGLFGGALGMVLAWGASFPGDAWVRSIVSSDLRIDLEEAIFVFPPWVVLAVLVFSVVVTTLAAVYPARRAARIDPVAALRHE